MEEENQRIADGEVTPADQVIIDKPSQPNFINDLFTPPPNNNVSEATQKLTPYDPPDLRDGLPIAESKEEQFSPSPIAETDERPESDNEEPKEIYDEQATKRDQEQVDAAFAEIDSIGGEEEDSSGDDGDWVYRKPEESIETEKDTFSPQHEIELISSAPEQIVHHAEEPHSPLSPKPSSPRSVEGFVTSVELNTPEENFNTNLAINQSTDFFAEGAVEQSSGPFSVYVSSSPEPGSIESVPVQQQAPLQTTTADTASNTELLISTEEHKPNEVEIIHAQSTVEVSPDDVPSPTFPSEYQPMPDIMTQSFTGDKLPEQPYNPQEVMDNMTASLTELSMQENGQVKFNGHFEETPIEVAEPIVQDLKHDTLESKPVDLLSDFDQPITPEPLLATQDIITNSVDDIVDEANILADNTKLSSEITVDRTYDAPQEPNLIDAPENLQEFVTVPKVEDRVSTPPSTEPTAAPIVEERPSTPEPVAAPRQSLEHEPVTPTNALKAPPKPAARTTSLQTSSRTPVSRVSKKDPVPKLSLKTTTKPATTKVEDKKPAASKLATTSKAPIKAIPKPATARPTGRPTAPKTAAPKTTTAATKTTTTTRPSARATSATTTTTAKRASSLAKTTTTTTKTTGVNPALKTNTTTTATSTTRRPLSAPRPTATSLARTSPATKDTKNTANKLISGRPSTGSTVKTTNLANKARPTSAAPISSKRPDMSGIKSKIDTGRRPVKKQENKPVESNGENKIADEETAVEKKDKLIEENPAEPNEEVLVNGNH